MSTKTKVEQLKQEIEFAMQRYTDAFKDAVRELVEAALAEEFERGKKEANRGYEHDAFMDALLRGYWLGWAGGDEPEDTDYERAWKEWSGES